MEYIYDQCAMFLKPHTHWATHDHADRLFDRSAVGMTD